MKKSARKELVSRKTLGLDKDLVVQGGALVKMVLDGQGHGLDLCPVLHKLSAHLENLAGETLAEYLKIKKTARDELCRAAKLLSRKYRRPENLRGYILYVAAILKKSVDTIAQHAKHIAVFLLAIALPEQARTIRAFYLRV